MYAHFYVLVHGLTAKIQTLPSQATQPQFCLIEISNYFKLHHASKKAKGPQVGSQSHLSRKELLMDKLKDYQGFDLVDKAGMLEGKTTSECIALLDEHGIESMVTLFCEADDCTKSNHFRDVAKELGYTMGDAMKLFLCLSRLLKECEAEVLKKANGAAMAPPLHTPNAKDVGESEKRNDSSNDLN